MILTNEQKERLRQHPLYMKARAYAEKVLRQKHIKFSDKREHPYEGDVSSH